MRPFRPRATAFALAALVSWSLASQLQAIVIRHDRDDARYRELGANYPAVGVVGRGKGDAATLVAPAWALTAAHVAASLPKTGATFRIGGEEIPIVAVHFHPEWTEMGPHDIALLRLGHPVPKIEPIPCYRGDDEKGKTAVFVGRGGTGTGLTGPTHEDGLLRGATNRIDGADADWLTFSFDAPESATDLEGISGPGDSGGPAILEVSGKRYVAGVSVWGQPGKAGRGTYGAGEGYTRVSTHRAWIDSILAGGL